MDGRPINRVLVIGGGGVLGALTASAFTDAGWEVRSADRRPGVADVELDVGRPGSVLTALDEQELVVNTVPQRELVAERLVLERGGTLINISALPAAAVRELRAEAGGARGTVVMNAGLAPGVTTIAAADLLRRYPEADELEMVFTVSASAVRGPASAEFVRRGLAAVARHRTVLVPLPDPFGERLCMGFGEDDAGWLGGIAEGRLVRPYICVLEPAMHEWLLTLNDVGGLTRMSRSLVRPRLPDSDQTTENEPVAHWVAAIRRDRRLGAWTVRCQGYFAHAARSAVVFAEALRAQTRSGGCFDPEEICTLEDVRGRLRDAGIDVVAAAASLRERAVWHGRTV
jgi:NAD(P)-dependent dehydrogenase (short-subunit alcohol dehydrogenase family)